jgi:hypothetical protein
MGATSMQSLVKRWLAAKTSLKFGGIGSGCGMMCGWGCTAVFPGGMECEFQLQTPGAVAAAAESDGIVAEFAEHGNMKAQPKILDARDIPPHAGAPG